MTSTPCQGDVETWGSNARQIFIQCWDNVGILQGQRSGPKKP